MTRRKVVLAAVTAVLMAGSMSTAATVSALKPIARCLGHRATIVGTPASETIRGTARPDVIVGGGSDEGDYGDSIYGRGGDDLICADLTDGFKTLDYGGRGDDRIVAVGNLYGGSGDDTLNDPLSHGNVFHLVGSRGDDVLRARGNDLTIFTPGPGDDTVTGQRGAWNLVGYTHSNGAVVVNLRKGTAVGQGHDLLHHMKFVFGSNYSDILIGDERLNLLVGLGGDDVLLGGVGRDVAEGGYGDDQVNGGSDNDELAGGAGRDILLGRAGNDQLTERDRPEANLIVGGPGRDNCSGGYHVPPNLERGCETHHSSLGTGEGHHFERHHFL